MFRRRLWLADLSEIGERRRRHDRNRPIWDGEDRPIGRRWNESSATALSAGGRRHRILVRRLKELSCRIERLKVGVNVGPCGFGWWENRSWRRSATARCADVPMLRPQSPGQCINSHRYRSSLVRQRSTSRRQALGAVFALSAVPRFASRQSTFLALSTSRSADWTNRAWFRSPFTIGNPIAYLGCI